MDTFVDPNARCLRAIEEMFSKFTESQRAQVLSKLDEEYSVERHGQLKEELEMIASFIPDLDLDGLLGDGTGSQMLDNFLASKLKIKILYAALSVRDGDEDEASAPSNRVSQALLEFFSGRQRHALGTLQGRPLVQVLQQSLGRLRQRA